jgi:hypothetical protein
MTTMNEKAARTYAKKHSVYVSKISDGAQRVVIVGGQIVNHRKDGGKSCWRINDGECVGRIGETIKAAVDLDIAAPVPVSGCGRRYTPPSHR